MDRGGAADNAGAVRVTAAQRSAPGCEQRAVQAGAGELRLQDLRIDSVETRYSGAGQADANLGRTIG